MNDAKKISRSNSFLVVISLIFFAFFLLKLIPQLIFWVDDTSAWVFFILFILFGFKPFWYRFRRK